MQQLTAVEKCDVAFSVARCARNVSLLWAIFSSVPTFATMETHSEVIGDGDSLIKRHYDEMTAEGCRMRALAI